MKKYLVILISLICICIPLHTSAMAFNFSVSQNINPSSQTVSNLFGIYENSDSYSPYKKFKIFQTAQNEYFLVASDDFSSGYYYCRYYNSGGTQSNYRYVSGFVNAPLNFSNSANYLIVGNEDGSTQLERAETTTTGYVCVIILVCILVFIILKIFRFKRSSPRTSMRL